MGWSPLRYVLASCSKCPLSEMRTQSEFPESVQRVISERKKAGRLLVEFMFQQAKYLRQQAARLIRGLSSKLRHPRVSPSLMILRGIERIAEDLPRMGHPSSKNGPPSAVIRYHFPVFASIRSLCGHIQKLLSRLRKRQYSNEYLVVMKEALGTAEDTLSKFVQSHSNKKCSNQSR